MAHDLRCGRSLGYWRLTTSLYPSLGTGLRRPIPAVFALRCLTAVPQSTWGRREWLCVRPEAAEGKAIVSVRSFSETHSFHSFMFALPASHIPLIQPALLTPPPFSLSSSASLPLPSLHERATAWMRVGAGGGAGRAGVITAVA